jgi:hypothetical protein
VVCLTKKATQTRKETNQARKHTEKLYSQNEKKLQKRTMPKNRKVDLITVDKLGRELLKNIDKIDPKMTTYK